MLTQDKYARGILRELYLRGALTRKQIMANLPMRLNSLVATSNRLEEEGFIFREEADRQRNVPLELNPKRFASVGIEHGESFAVFTLLNSTAEHIVTERVDLPQEVGGTKRLRRIISLIDDFIRRNSEYEVFMLGFADIGIVKQKAELAFILRIYLIGKMFHCSLSWRAVSGASAGWWAARSKCT